MINFEFCSSTKFVFGRGSEAKTGALVKEFGGTKVLVHFGGGSVIDSAKAIAFGATYDGDFTDHAFGKDAKVMTPVPSAFRIRRP